MIDFEDVDNNGAPLLNIGDFWNLVNALNSVGLNVALGYIPQFYFADIGRPDLSALASNGIALISADFVDGSGYASVLYPGNNAPGWSPYGGASPTIYQFTDQGIVAGNNEIDCDAYLGTLPELQQLLTGSLATTQARRRKRLQRRR
jgi:hypothetical protein